MRSIAKFLGQAALIATVTFTAFGAWAATPNYALTVTKSGTGSGSVACDGGTCSATYSSGKKVVLAAAPAAGSTFAGWGGTAGCSGTSTCTLTMTGAKSVTATFNVLPSYALTVTKTGAGSGSVTCDGGACSATYVSGKNVVLAAAPAAGSTFAGWGGTAGCSGTSTCTLTMTAAKSVTATFDNMSELTTRTSVTYPFSIAAGATQSVLSIPAGALNPVVFLSADNDADIEIWGGSPLRKIVGRSASPGNGAGQARHSVDGDVITASGYDGQWASISSDTKSGVSKSKSQGREFVRISGRSKNIYQVKIYGNKAAAGKVIYSSGVNIIYAGILGMGPNYLGSESNPQMFQYSATNGLMPSFHADLWGGTFSGYGGTIDQANNVCNGINMPFSSGAVYNGGQNSKGQAGVAIKLSNYAKGAGDFGIYASGGVTWVFNKMKILANENVNNVIFISGHSSGGGDAQDLLWKFKEIGQSIKASFQIDSVEVEVANYGDARIPSNTAAGYNFWENEVWYAIFGPRESYIYAEDSTKTTIQNTQIVKPMCVTSTGACKEDSHEAIDNDSRVWQSITNTVSSLVKISGFTE